MTKCCGVVKLSGLYGMMKKKKSSFSFLLLGFYFTGPKSKPPCHSQHTFMKFPFFLTSVQLTVVITSVQFTAVATSVQWTAVVTSVQFTAVAMTLL